MATTNDTEGCRYPRLGCDRVCMECRGDFDIIDRKTGAVVDVVSDTAAMNRMLREFGEPEDTPPCTCSSCVDPYS